MENCDSHFSGMFSHVNWWLVADVSGQLMCPRHKGEAVPWRQDPQLVSERRWLTTNQPCVTSQKSEDLMCTAVEPWNHAEKRKLHGADRHSVIRVTRRYGDVGAGCVIGGGVSSAWSVGPVGGEWRTIWPWLLGNWVLTVWDGLKQSAVVWSSAVSTVTLFCRVTVHCPGERPAVCILLGYQLACSLCLRLRLKIN